MGCFLVAWRVFCSAGPVHAEVPSLERVSARGRVFVEILNDDLIHFEFSPTGAPSRAGARAYSTPMVVRQEHAESVPVTRRTRGSLETQGLRLKIDGALCLRVTDLTRTPATRLATLCPESIGQNHNVLAVAKGETRNLYGLGEHFLDPGEANGDLLGRVIRPGNEFGNDLPPFNGGFTGNAQFPVLYALDGTGRGYLLFLDSLYAQTWDLTGDPWRVTMGGDVIRGYLLGGAEPARLRRRYMALVGRPRVPPKKMFGLWVSEFGFDDWAELEDKLRTLRANHFPVDGFVLDLQWYGGVFNRPSHMGALTFDPSRFPDPRAEIERLRGDGVGLMLIEESYLDASRPEEAALAARGYLPRACEGCAPVHLDSWWGSGSMLDWTNDAAGDYWHDLKRQPLVEMGVLGHWTDLGEPEDFSPSAWYHGFPELGLHAHRDIHNIYNFKWIESIAHGYSRHHDRRRPFMLSRSGTAGIERFGAAMWSGDIGSNLSSLAAQLNVHMHMSFSGIDYFGADIGGFHREALDGDLNEMYTVWFANAALLDVPVRPHTENLCNCKETAPDRIGDLASNRENLRLRYRLIPYLYSLAHRAHRTGEPLAPPLPLYYPGDPNVRRVADERLLGHDLLVATVSAYGQAKRDVYLPAGTWINVHTGACVASAGEWAHDVPTWVDGTFKVPLFARAGAIIPEMPVDDQTMNALGARLDGGTRDELIVRFYADDASPRGAPPARRRQSRFTLYEDDGETVAYLDNAVRITRISQKRRRERVTLSIGAAVGDYAGAPHERDNVIELMTCGAEPAAVTLDGVVLERRATRAEFAAGGPGWYAAGDGVVRLRSGSMDVKRPKRFVVRLVRQ